MSDRPLEPAAAPDSVGDPELRDLQREKLRAEVRKLEVDNSLANRLFTTVLSLSAVAIAASQIVMALQQRAADAVREDHDQSLKQIELHIRQVESGLKLSQFAIDQRTLFLAASADEQVRAVRLVQALLPIEEAGRMLDAMGKVATQAEVLNEVATSQLQLASAAPPKPALNYQVRPTPPPPATVNQPTPSPPPAAIEGQPLKIYYHIQRAEDRDLANALSGAMTPKQFPSAGVQLIRQGPTAAQVRYYKPTQITEAKALAQTLSHQVESLTGTSVQFNAIDISATFPNLPSDRVEVWFAPSMPAMKSS